MRVSARMGARVCGRGQVRSMAAQGRRGVPGAQLVERGLGRLQLEELGLLQRPRGGVHLDDVLLEGGEARARLALLPPPQPTHHVQLGAEPLGLAPRRVPLLVRVELGLR